MSCWESYILVGVAIEGSNYLTSIPWNVSSVLIFTADNQLLLKFHHTWANAFPYNFSSKRKWDAFIWVLCTWYNEMHTYMYRYTKEWVNECMREDGKEGGRERKRERGDRGSSYCPSLYAYDQGLIDLCTYIPTHSDFSGHLVCWLHFRRNGQRGNSTTWKRLYLNYFSDTRTCLECTVHVLACTCTCMNRCTCMHV